MSFESIELCGVRIARASQAQLLAEIDAALDRGEGGWLVTANVDFLQRAHADPEVRSLYRKATLSVADGAPVVWASRLAGRPVPERVAGSDLVWSLARMAAPKGRRLYLLGGEGDVAERAAEKLLAASPGLVIAGRSSPWVSSPPTGEEIAALAEQVVAARPDLVYVALGSPKQEYVIDALRAQLPRAWLMGCGISLAFVAGEVARAPRWMQRSGLEWLHRLAQEPGRLTGRYLRQNLPFTLRLLAGAWRARGAQD
jgi:N-acetylglucosaminyldiphosphoundecaprenol N-acetyl-beta-D-mannosaminyltransferase